MVIKITKKIHGIWKELAGVKKKNLNIPPIIGKWHYIFKSEKGEISLIELKDYFKKRENLWEIMELSANNLFEDVERFPTKKEAEKRIRSLL